MSRSIIHIALAAMLLVGLAACASSGGSTAYSAQNRLQPASHEVDTERVALIERAARQRGVEVHWVNMPRKVVQDESGPR
jgi:hypothetical protein